MLATIRSDEPYPHAYLEIQPAEQAYQWVLANVGATLPQRDAVDERIIDTVSHWKRDGGRRAQYSRHPGQSKLPGKTHR